MASCMECRFFVYQPAELELAVPGLNILSSAYGAVRDRTGLCEQRDIFLTPELVCSQFQPKCSLPVTG